MKRYLTGIDWIINSIDHAGKTQSGIGNVSQVVIELTGRPDSELLAESLRDFVQQFPLVNGSPARALNLCPYWKIPRSKKLLAPRVAVIRLDHDADIAACLSKAVNEPFQDKREHLVLNLVYAPERTYVSMVFDHRLLDARGAEAFLDLFHRYHQKETLPYIAVEEDPHLDRWKEKFIAGRQVNRVFIGLTRNTPRTIPMPLDSRACIVNTVNLDPNRSERFTNNAYTKAGYLMLMPYALAKSVQIMHRVFETKKISGETYVIPVSIDARPQKTVCRELFFNHASFFLFKIPVEIVSDLSALVSRIKEQMYDQVKTGLPDAIKNASMLLRIAPLPLVSFFLQALSKKSIASFSFSFVGSAYTAERFINEEIQNIFHLPRVPNPPGLGVFFNHYANRINASLSYGDGVLTESEAGRITDQLKALGNEE